MKGYLSIGKVAKLKGVSIKSLRYYDEIGILKPAFINEQTNYRYYKEEQLLIIDAITLCIELGIPLKEFDKYRNESGDLRLSDLLFDGKQLAEKKIHSMSRCLETLQKTLTMLETKEPLPPYTVKSLPSRTVLLIPFDETTSIENHNPKLLELLVTSQKLGLSSSYPSGILYRRQKGLLKKYVCIHITGNESYTQFDSSGIIENLPDTRCLLLKLPGHEYACHESTVSAIDSSERIFGSLLSSKENYILLEIKNIEKRDKNASALYELLLLLP